MKILRILALVILLPFTVLAQDLKDITIKEGTLKMGKKKMPCQYAEYPFDKAHTQASIDKMMGREELKRSARKKGVNIYRGIVWTAIAPTKNDYYIKVKSKKGNTIVYLAVSKGYDNYVTLTNDPLIAGKTNYFLKKLNGQISNDIFIEKNETELKVMEAKNEQASQELKEAKKAQAEKAKEVEKLKRHDAPNPTR